MKVALLVVVAAIAGVFLAQDSLYGAPASEPAPHGSAAVTGAATNLLGDVNCDGAVNAVDALGVLRYVAATPPVPECIDQGDVNCDGAVNTVDALGILRFTAALPVAQNPGCPDIGTPLTIAPPGDLTTAPTTYDRIEDALEQGQIDEETALMYTVFAGFGDARLPAQFQGDDRDLIHPEGLDELRSRFDTLSPGTQEVLAPYLLPPYVEGSWADILDVQDAGGAVPAGALPAWNKIETANGEAQVWWRRPEDQAKAQELAAAMNTIWPQLVNLMGRPPLSDINEPNNGGDGKFDIYLAKMRAKGGFVLYGDCPSSPGYILINRDQGINSLGVLTPLPSVLAHEFMHAIQFAFNSASCGDQAWWLEASATWAMYYVYPQDKTRHPYGQRFLDFPKMPLDSLADRYRPYGAYLFPFFLTERFQNPGIIRQIWQAMESMPVMDAIDASIPGGFEEVWPEFAAHNWNPDWAPLNRYRAWDSFGGAARAVSHPGPVQVNLGGTPDERIEIPVELDPLSSQYNHYVFSDDDVSVVTFHNGLSFDLSEAQFEGINVLQTEDLPAGFNEGVGVQALVKLRGQDWQVVDLRDQPVITFCRDRADQRIDELVLIFSNAVHDAPDHVLSPTGLDPTLWVSNLGCWGWDGTASFNSVSDGVTIQTSGEIRWEAVSGLGDIGIDFPLPPGFIVGLHVTYLPVSGSAQWSVSGTDSQGCVHSGSGTVNFGGTGPPGAALLNTFNGVLPGVFYRGYWGVAINVDGGMVTVNCPNQPPLQAPMPVTLIIGSDENGAPTADPGGKLLQGQFIDSGVTAAWHFEALRQ